MSYAALRIGTRGSPLALKQTEMVVEALQAKQPGIITEIVVIQTSGDWKPEHGENRLSEAEGGKGLFAKEIEQALLDEKIDCAVHSMKDMESFLPSGLALDHVLPRGDVRDAFICEGVSSFKDLPQGASVATSSLRRQAYILHHRPDLNITTIRGNVQTRMDKVRNGHADATLLAMAGIVRLGISQPHIHPIEVQDILPACGQGCITIQTHTDDDTTRHILGSVHCARTHICVQAERAALQVLDGSCHTPIGAYAVFQNDKLYMRISVLSDDGKQFFMEDGYADTQDLFLAKEMGKRLGDALRKKAPKELFA